MEDKYRICDICGKRHGEGYYLAGAYACSDECRREYYKNCEGAPDDIEADEMYYRDSEDDESEYFWTEWWDS